jgi:hypothetical protein
MDSQRLQDQQNQHRHYLWAYYSVIVIGLWLMTGFFPMGYEQKSMIINDIICGALLVVTGFLALNPTRILPMFIAALIGGWLCVAPLIFHAESAAAYTTGTLMGVLVMSFVLVIPNLPGIQMIVHEGSNVPPGWSYNPSAWSERIPVVFLGWLGFFTARYLAGFQLGYSDTIWDPFFGDGTRQILTSDVSESFPVSDAGLGAFAYILDVITGLTGRTARWRTMPWIVLLFGFLVIPLGIVSLTLVILQPLSVGAWCTACLLSALITVAMIPFTFDEVLASVQFIRKRKKLGHGIWKTFWFGGPDDEGSIREYTDPGNVQFRKLLSSLWEDLSIKPWTLFFSIALGLWFMASPGIFGYTGGVADSNHLVGAIIVSISIIAMSEVVRIGRFLNILCALWLIMALWIFGNPGGAVLWTQLAAGILLILVTFKKGIIKDEHGGYNQYIH